MRPSGGNQAGELAVLRWAREGCRTQTALANPSQEYNSSETLHGSHMALSAAPEQSPTELESTANPAAAALSPVSAITEVWTLAVVPVPLDWMLPCGGVEGGEGVTLRSVHPLTFP